jgi:hypothetical protein
MAMHDEDLAGGGWLLDWGCGGGAISLLFLQLLLKERKCTLQQLDRSALRLLHVSNTIIVIAVHGDRKVGSWLISLKLKRIRPESFDQCGLNAEGDRPDDPVGVIHIKSTGI